MDVDVEESQSQRELFSTEIAQLRASGASYEEVTMKRHQLLENYAMTMEEVEIWYADALKHEESEGEYGVLYSVFFEALQKDHHSVRFYEMCLNYYLNWVIAGPPAGFEDLELFQDQDLKELFDATAIYAQYDFQKGHNLLNIRLKYIWYKSGYTIKGLFEEGNRDGEPTTEILQDTVILFNNQLTIPHEHLDETFSRFSSFVSANLQDQYNMLMAQANTAYQETKKAQTSLEFIFAQSHDITTEEQWSSLLQNVASLPKKDRRIGILSSVFENAIEEFNTPALWTQYITILYDNLKHTSLMIRPTLLRFVRFHPRHIPAYSELVRSATSIEDFVQVQSRSQKENLLHQVASEHWTDLVCALLSTQERLGSSDLDLQRILQQAIKREADTFHSVERFIASIYEKRGDIVNSRKLHQLLTNTFTSEAEGWLISYNFERRQGDIAGAQKILIAAINRAEQLDWPERIFEEAIRFSDLYGDLDTYRSLRARIEKKKAAVDEARALSAENVTAAQFEELEIVDNTNKRKAADTIDDEYPEEPHKRKETTRDREHLTVAVRNIPLHAQDKHIKHFFKDCGVIREIKLTALDDSQQANVEFTEESGVLRALTKDYKTISGREVRVQKLHQSTVFVTNFPPPFTQEQIREVFSVVGAVVSVRLPSLKFNSQRRFAYVEYTEPSNAQAAVGLLNGKEIEGFTLSVQISDPSAKKNRSGAVEEGREVYVTKLDFYKVTANKVKQLFEKRGTVESVHLPLSNQNRAMNKNHDGYGFVVFSTPEEAQAALDLNMVTLEGRVIQVSISEKKSVRAKKEEGKAFNKLSHSDNAIALANLPDTISAPQLMEFFATVGDVEDVVLEPKSSGAIVLFKNNQDAGNASLSLDGKTIGNYRVQITTVNELRKVDNTQKTVSKAPSMLMPSNLRRRKVIQRATPITESTPTTSTSSTPGSVQPSSSEPPRARSNADFRAMLLGKK